MTEWKKNNPDPSRVEAPSAYRNSTYRGRQRRRPARTPRRWRTGSARRGNRRTRTAGIGPSPHPNIPSARASGTGPGPAGICTRLPNDLELLTPE